MPRLGQLALQAALAATTVAAGSLADIEHVVLFMQENRAFDHYFGTMAGIRGFSDPNAQVNAGNRSVFYQNVNGTLSNATDYLLPWYLNYLGGDWPEATQCMDAGSNGWQENHDALNGGLNDMWALGNTPWSWGHYKKDDLPTHFAIAEGWTVGDMYQESVIASTNPNRVTWLSGSINTPGSPQTPGEGGIYIDNNETPGCEAPGLNCYPLNWKTTPEFYEDSGVSWQLFQDQDNFDDNPLAWFEQYQIASNESALGIKGMSYVGLDKFYADAAAGTLPQVSIIVGPAELSEHPPYQPKDGAWLQQQVVNAVVHGKAYDKTALIISYDETGGWGDHVIPYHSPTGTAGEWVEDPYDQYGYVYTGPGFRLPFYIVSPWTRGGYVYTENADHNSQIKFVEQWLAAKGHNVTTNQMATWRRENMADLTKAFDFDHPDYSIPAMPTPATPSFNTSAGLYDGYAVCEATYATQRPPVPYGQQEASTSLVSEQGFKQVRGQLTEGRYLTFEMNGFALTAGGSNVSATKATSTHNTKSQRFVLNQLAAGSNQFTVTSALTGKQVGTYTLNDLGFGNGYTMQSANGQFVSIGKNGQVAYSSKACTTGFSIFSVTYSN